MDLEKIVDFIIKYSNHKIKSEIKRIIQLHILYKTCVVLYKTPKQEEVIAVCRWNISKGKTVAHVLDLIIKPEYRNKNFIKRLLIKGLKMWPSVKFLQWEREAKYSDRASRIYSIERILKRSPSV